MSFLWNRRTTKRVSPPGGKFSDSDLEFNRIFEDDFVHKNHLTINYAGKGLNFSVKSKATVDLKGATLQKADPKTSFSTKVVTQVCDSAVETKLDNKGTIRVWSDMGTYDFGVPLTFAAKLKTNNVFDRLSWFGQVQSKHGDVSASNRFHVKANGHVFWNSKLQYQRGDLMAGLITKLSTSTFLLSKLTVYSVYQLKNNTLYAELANQGNGLKSDPTSQVVTLAATCKAKNNNYGAKLSYNLLNKANPLSFSVGTVAKINKETTIRAKVDNKAVFAISAKHVRNSNLTLQVGTAVTLNEPSSFTTNKVVPVPIGISLNLNYL